MAVVLFPTEIRYFFSVLSTWHPDAWIVYETKNAHYSCRVTGLVVNKLMDVCEP